MATKPGEIMGYLAFGHPFLAGNGRTIIVVHGVLASALIGSNREVRLSFCAHKRTGRPARASSTPTSSPLFATQRPVTARQLETLRRPVLMEALTSMK